MTSINEKTCNCRAESKCPLDGKCLTTSIVYKAEITPTDTQETKEYIGITAGPFKERYNNHKKSLLRFPVEFGSPKVLPLSFNVSKECL